MLILNPRIVRFGAIVWNDVEAITIDRTAKTVVEDFGDLGPHVTFADVPEQRVRIRIIQQPVREGVNAPRPGDQATLSFHTSLTGGDTGRRKISTTAIVTAVEHELAAPRGPRRTIALLAISDTGAADPITMTAL